MSLTSYRAAPPRDKPLRALTEKLGTENGGRARRADQSLTECSAILKYLAEKTSSPTYPKDLKARARVNKVMDWFNTGFNRDLGYGVVYPQVLPDYL